MMKFVSKRGAAKTAPLLIWASPRYLPEDTTPAGRVVQNAVNGVVKEQKQPLAHGRVALQVPPQVVDFVTPLRN